MTELLKYQPFDWERFWKSRHVQSMSSTEVRGIYALFIGLMWSNGGWLPNNDVVIAGKLMMDVRRWKARYRGEIIGMCLRTRDAVLGEVLTHEVVDEVWAKTLDLIARNQSRTARGRAQVLENRRRRQSATFATRPPPAEPPGGGVAGRSAATPRSTTEASALLNSSNS